MPDLEIHYADDWAALYVDGKLERVGDTYHAEERALNLCGVVLVQNNAFMRGQTAADGVAKTLDEIRTYAADRDLRIARAQRLREQAADLVHKASQIEKGEVL
jgi:hypothetical protein